MTGSDDGLPVVAPPFDPGDRPETRVAGVLLAAGTSSRFGDANKLLATLNGEPLVRRAARTLAAAGLDPDAVDAAVFALGDMPGVSPDSVRLLVAAHRAGRGSALAAAHEGVRGNPVLFDSRHFPALAGVDGDVGGREILRSGEDSALVETGDPGVRRDVDTRDDLAAVSEEG